MAVRTRVILKFGDKEISTVAIANSGYEAEEPEIILPVNVAKLLGLYPELPYGSKIEEYKAVGGVSINAITLEKKILIKVKTIDRETNYIKAIPVIISGENEVILSDKVIDAFGIILLKPGAGLWRFTDDPIDKVRVSEKPEKW